MDKNDSVDRRAFIGSTLALGATLSLFADPVFSKEEEEDEDDDDDVSAVEDLMREHGALNRILLIYEECQRRIRGKKEFKMKVVAEATSIIRNFIENYHEKLEEEFIFPRLEKANKFADLAKTLKAQHDAGRKVTFKIQSLANAPLKSQTYTKLDNAITAFVRMYRPHEAFEDADCVSSLQEAPAAGGV